MKAFIIFLLLGLLLGIMLPLSFAQQNQSTQELNPEVEAIKKQISVLQNQLQTVGNEKIELVAKLLDTQAKLAEANAKLLNAETDRYKRELKDANDEWLRTWSLWFVGIIGFFVLIIGGASWFWLKSLIADRVEKSLPGFKDAMDQADELENQLKVLEKEHAASVLENFMNVYYDAHSYPQSIKVLSDETLLQVFGNKGYRLPIREKAVEVLADRKSPQLISPVLEFLNSIVDSDFDWQTSIDGERLPFRFLNFIGQIHTDEAHQGLKKFLNRLLTENPKHKDLFLTWTAYYLIYIDVELGMDDSVSMIKKAIPNLDNLQQLSHVVDRLVEYFVTFDEPEGIKEILTNSLTDQMPDVEDKCLELLQKHDPEFVKGWKEQKAAAETETEESS